MSRLKHTLNTVYVVFDLLISAYPIRIFHVVYTTILATIYIVFNATYFLSDGRGPDGQHYAYYVLNWKSPAEATVTIMLECILSLCVQMVLFSIYKLRCFIFNKIYSIADDASETQHMLDGTEQKYNTVENMEMKRTER